MMMIISVCYIFYYQIRHILTIHSTFASHPLFSACVASQALETAKLMAEALDAEGKPVLRLGVAVGLEEFQTWGNEDPQCHENHLVSHGKIIARRSYRL